MSGSVPPPDTNKKVDSQIGLPLKKEEMPVETKVALEAIEETKILFDELPFADLSDHEIVELAAEDAAEVEEGEEQTEQVEQKGRAAGPAAKKGISIQEKGVEHLFAKGSIPWTVVHVAKGIVLKMARQLEQKARVERNQRRKEDEKARGLKERVQREEIKRAGKKSYAKRIKEKQRETQSQGKYQTGMSKTPPSKADPNPKS